MIPRRVLDIGWRHLAQALWHTLRAPCAPALPAGAAAFLSVRSGLDALLSALALPAGSEVLMSAVTVPDMAAIVRAHGLQVVALDVNADTLAVSADEAERRVTSRTRVLLVAHLFGSRMPMDALADVADRHGLLLLEDCAQAFSGQGNTAHARTDVAFYSFGPIKTATALGGALLFFRDDALRRAALAVQAAWPVQPAPHYARRCVRHAALKLLSLRGPYTVFCTLCRLLRVDRNALIRGATRNFAPSELLPQLRQQPPAAMVALMLRRWHEPAVAVVRRMVAAQALGDAMGDALGGDGAALLLGRTAAGHTHWVVPVRCAAPEQLARQLQARGFDASRSASSLTLIGDAREARAWHDALLYLPVHEDCTPRDMRRLAAALRSAIEPARQGAAQPLTTRGATPAD